jgi:hypothetical protein
MPKPPDVTKIGDPVKRALAISALIDKHQDAIVHLSRLRHAALAQLIDSGMTQNQLAKLLGMSKGRVSQLLSASPRVGNDPSPAQSALAS